MRRRGSEPGCKRESGKTGGEYDASQLPVGRRERRQMDGDEKEGETSLERLAEVNLAYYQETEHTHVTAEQPHPAKHQTHQTVTVSLIP